MTKARTRCGGCREYFQFNIKKDKSVCPLCGFVNDTTPKTGLFIKDENFKRT